MATIPKSIMNRDRALPNAAGQAATAPAGDVGECAATPPAFVAWLQTYRRRLEQTCELSTYRLFPARKSGPE